MEGEIKSETNKTAKEEKADCEECVSMIKIQAFHEQVNEKTTGLRDEETNPAEDKDPSRVTGKIVVETVAASLTLEGLQQHVNDSTQSLAYQETAFLIRHSFDWLAENSLSPGPSFEGAQRPCATPRPASQHLRLM